MKDYLGLYPARPAAGVARFADGGAAPGGPAPGGAAPGGPAPSGAAPGGPAPGGAPGGDPALMAAGADPNAPQGAGMDPAQNGAQQAGADVVGQIQGLVDQYLQAPSAQIEKEGWQLVVQAFGSGDPAAAGADPMAGAGAMGGAMPPPAGAGAAGAAPPPEASGMPAGGMPAPGQFRRGGPVPTAPVLLEMPAPAPVSRRAVFGQ